MRERRAGRAAERRSAVPCAVAPRPASEDPLAARVRTHRVSLYLAAVSTSSVLAPLFDIAQHVVEPPSIGLLLTNRMRPVSPAVAVVCQAIAASLPYRADAGSRTCTHTPTALPSAATKPRPSDDALIQLLDRNACASSPRDVFNRSLETPLKSRRDSCRSQLRTTTCVHGTSASQKPFCQRHLVLRAFVCRLDPTSSFGRTHRERARLDPAHTKASACESRNHRRRQRVRQRSWSWSSTPTMAEAWAWRVVCAEADEAVMMALAQRRCCDVLSRSSGFEPLEKHTSVLGPLTSVRPSEGSPSRAFGHRRLRGPEVARRADSG